MAEGRQTDRQASSTRWYKAARLGKERKRKKASQKKEDRETLKWLHRSKLKEVKLERDTTAPSKRETN